MSLLTTRDLAVDFGSAVALSGVDLDLEQGELVAVVGPSGSGKSTLLHCLAGLQRPNAGDVVFDGTAMSGLSERERSALRLAAFGMVFQSGYLVPELTLLENAALPSWILGVQRDKTRARAGELFDRLGIADVAGRLPAEVSGGQLQRAAVARALAHRPRVLFADEPTGNLDSTNSVLVFDALCEQSQALGALVVVVTHETSLAQRCERVVTLTDGRVESDRSISTRVG